MASRTKLREAESAVSDHLLQVAADVVSKDVLREDRRSARALAREHLFLEDFRRAAERTFAGWARPAGYAKRHAQPKEAGRILNLLLSDLHFGAMLDPREVGRAYGHKEEARRLAAVCLKTAEHETDHRDETTLYLHLAGDVIQGNLHDPREGAPSAEQGATAMGLLTQAVTYLASAFPRVVVRCTPGNHGRNPQRHHLRAVNQKWDAVETVLYEGVKMATRGLPNLHFEIGYRPYYDYRAFGRHGFVTHGDTVISPGYPGKSIDVRGVTVQVNQLNAQRPQGKRYQLVAVGHVHTGSVTYLPGGTVFVSNGALVPPDAYALSIGIFDSTCGQQLWESTPAYIMGDSRLLIVDAATDRDATLDEVIQPFRGL